MTPLHTPAVHRRTARFRYHSRMMPSISARYNSALFDVNWCGIMQQQCNFFSRTGAGWRAA
jgi:hypothetical protein